MNVNGWNDQIGNEQIWIDGTRNKSRETRLSLFLLLLDYQIPIQIIFHGYVFFRLHSNSCLRRIIILSFFFVFICAECFYKARFPWNERWKVKNHSFKLLRDSSTSSLLLLLFFFVHLFLNMSYECILNIWTPTNNKTASTFGNQTHLVFNQIVFDVWQVQNAKTLENQIEHARKRLFERHLTLAESELPIAWYNPI